MNPLALKERRGREFPRYKIPLAALIDGKRVVVCDWSTNGLGLVGTNGLSLVIGAQHLITVLVETETSTMEIQLTIRVVWCNPRTARAGLEILDNSEKTQQLAGLADLYLGGQLDERNKKLIILGKQMSDRVKAKSAIASEEQQPRGANAFVGRFFGLLVFTLIGVVAFMFLFNVVYKRIFTFDALSAYVDVNTINVVQPDNGIIKFLVKSGEVKSGEKIAEINLDEASSTGKTKQDIFSPCDCYLLEDSTKRIDGSYGRAGTFVASLIEQDAKPFVSVQLPFRRLKSLSEHPKVTLTYPDGTVITGLKIISIPKISKDTSPQIKVIVEPGRKITPSMIGDVVYAVFDNAPWN